MESDSVSSPSETEREVIQAKDSSLEFNIPPIPAGFTSLRAPDGQIYLVPTFWVDATCYAYHRENEITGTLPDTAAGGVSEADFAAWVSNHRHLS